MRVRANNASGGGGGGSQSYYEVNTANRAANEHIQCVDANGNTFRPKYLIAVTTAGSQRCVVWDESMGNNCAIYEGGYYTAQRPFSSDGTQWGLKSIDADGFTLGNYYGSGWSNFSCLASG